MNSISRVLPSSKRYSKQVAPFAELYDGCTAWNTIEAMSITKTTLYDERDWMQLDPLSNNSSPNEFMARVTLALKYHIPYLKRSFESNTSISEWVLAQTPFVHGYAARVMFDALDVDEKNNPSVVASRISEIMSGENIYMLDITEEPPDAMDEPIEKKVLPDDGGHSREIVSPLHAEAAETRAEAREAAARAEVTKARTEAARTAAWGNARIEAAEAVARAKEAAIHAEGAMARTEMWDAATEMWERISIRNASFADELSERESDAQRLSTPRRLIDER